MIFIIKVIVENGDLNTAIRKLTKYSADVRKEVLKHQYHLRPGLKKALKSKEAQRRDARIANILWKKAQMYAKLHEKDSTETPVETVNDEQN